MKTKAQELGEAIEKDRARTGASQEYIAQAVGVTQQAFSEWKNGKSLPRMPKLRKLSEVFGEESETAKIIKHWRVFFSYNAQNKDLVLQVGEALQKNYVEAEHLIPTTVLSRKKLPGPDMGTLTSEPKQSGPPTSSDEPTAHVEQTQAGYGIKSFEERSNPSIDMRDALTRAAKGVHLARQVLDDATDQLDRAIANLPRI